MLRERDLAIRKKASGVGHPRKLSCTARPRGFCKSRWHGVLGRAKAWGRRYRSSVSGYHPIHREWAGPGCTNLFSLHRQHFTCRCPTLRQASGGTDLLGYISESHWWVAQSLRYLIETNLHGAAATEDNLRNGVALHYTNGWNQSLSLLAFVCSTTRSVSFISFIVAG
jgi:hypothetical protein